jgi:hypothetical protein
MADQEQQAKDDGVHDLTAYVQNLLQQMVGVHHVLLLLTIFHAFTVCIDNNNQI